MALSSSPTESIAATAHPSARTARAMRAELVSDIRPLVNSFPIVNIPIFILSSSPPARRRRAGIHCSYPAESHQEPQDRGGVDGRRQIIGDHPVSTREPLLEKSRRKGLHDVEEAEQDEAQGRMERRRRYHKKGPLHARDLVDHDAGSILPA